jgi:uncharacterized protein with PhoU and TrkA domain
VQLPPSMVGQTLMRVRLTERFGVNVLVIKTGDHMIVAPPGDTLLNSGDVLVVVGPNEHVHRLVAQR